MAAQPREVSHGLAFVILEKNPAHISTKDAALNFSPKSPLICVEATVNAAAEQNPEITGADINSTKNPVKLY